MNDPYRSPAETSSEPADHPLIAYLKLSYNAANGLPVGEQSVCTEAWGLLIDVVVQVAAKEASYRDASDIMKRTTEAVKLLEKLRDSEYGEQE